MSSKEAGSRQDFITVLTLADDEPGVLAKVWTADGKIEPIADHNFFRSDYCPLDSLQLLERALLYLEKFPRSCVVRAERKPDVNPLSHRRTSRKTEADMADVAHHWFCIDCDKVILPFGWSSTDIEKIGTFLRSRLPAPLDEAACIVQLSSSAGHPSREGMTSAHLWFWARERRDSVQMRAWLGSLTTPAWLDTSTLRAVQIHFTAPPVIDGIDPVPRRIMLLPGKDFSTPEYVRTPIVSLETARARRHGPGPEATTRFINLVERSGVLRSKGPHMGRPARIAYLDILINEFGFGDDVEVLHEQFMGACVGPQDPDAESDFSEAMQWAAQPSTGERIRAGSILQSVEQWAQNKPLYIDDIQFVYRALKSSNVAEMRDRTESLASEAQSKGILVPIVTTDVMTAGNISMFPMPAAQRIEMKSEARQDRDELIRAKKFSIHEAGRGNWIAATLPEVKTLSGAKESPLTSIENIFVVVNSAGAAVRRNDWTGKIEIYWINETKNARPIRDEDVARIFAHGRSEYGSGWFSLQKGFLEDGIAALAAENRYDSMLTHIEELNQEPKLEGQDYFDLDNWLPELFHVEDSPYHRACGRYLVGGMVNRILNPGIKSDEAVVLISEKMGLGKSTAIETLAPFPEAYGNGLKLGMTSKEILEITAGKAIVEMDEMERMRGRDVEAMRSMLSTSVDLSRMSYGRHATERPRRFLCTGSCNKTTPLTDEYGNRRFLPVTIFKPINLSRLAAIKDHLIRSAYAEYMTGVASFRIPEHLWDESEKQQSAATYLGAFHDYFSLAIEEELSVRYELFRAQDLWAFAYSNYRSSPKGFNNAMKNLGFRQGRAIVDGTRTRVWARENINIPNHQCRIMNIDQTRRQIVAAQITPMNIQWG